VGASLPLSGAEPMHPFEGREEMRDKALEEIVEIFQRLSRDATEKPKHQR